MDVSTVKQDLHDKLSVYCKSNNESCDKYKPLIPQIKTADENTLKGIIQKLLEEIHNRMAEVKGFSGLSKKNQELAIYINNLNNTTTFRNSDTIKCVETLAPSDEGFNELAGMKVEKQKMEAYYIRPFEYPNLYKTLPKGLLLYSVPGTGKTQLVLASSKELAPKSIIFAPSPGDIRGSHEGETEKNIGNIFKCAGDAVTSGKYENAIVFFDEIDAIASISDNPLDARARGALLQAIDGVKSNPKVSVLGATNFPEKIDHAIMRRFDLKIFVDLPGFDARKFIIKKHIILNYNFPKDIQEYKNLSKNTKNKNELMGVYLRKAIENITMYSSGDKEIKSGYGFLGVRLTDKKETEIWIDNNFIDEMAHFMGPRDSVKNEIKHTRGTNDIEYSKNTENLYGYSASDINKIMNLSRIDALQDVLVPSSRFFKDKDGFYIYTPGESENTVSLESIPDKKKILAFNLRPSNVLKAIKEYKYTYDIDEYKRMVKMKE